MNIRDQDDDEAAFFKDNNSDDEPPFSVKVEMDPLLSTPTSTSLREIIQKSLTESRNLDAFLLSCYKYYTGKGFISIILLEITNLLYLLVT